MAITKETEGLEEIAAAVRGTVVDLSFTAGTPHLASALSCVDILVAAYWGGLELDPSKAQDPWRDRLILSKGHAAIALYATLAHRGYFPMEVLKTFVEPGSHLPEQPSPGCVPGVEVASGSLGHGLSLGLGMALACRIQGHRPRTLVVMSDGECNEGSVWEAAMFAPANAIDNVAVVVDYNKWQATGRSNEIMAIEPLHEKWGAFGWRSCEIDGHDVVAMSDALRSFPDETGRPLAIVAHTTKGKGISFMEDNNDWHYRIPTAKERDRAHSELGLR